MHLADHYKILELDTTATLPEIKKAYRRLALQYHPDKNLGNPYARAYFDAVKEAYETLTDPVRKHAYLQQRWYDKSTGKRPGIKVIDPVFVLQETILLEKKASRMDVHRLDAAAIRTSILTLLNDTVIEKLNEFAEIPVNDSIIRLLLRVSKMLPYAELLVVLPVLRKMTVSDMVQKEILLLEQKSFSAYKWGKYRTAGIIILTLLLCIIIYWLAS